ncbi:acyltransferase, partial [Bacillus spizizenii]|nr:acyltransferase [Bacillus spizizenii]
SVLSSNFVKTVAQPFIELRMTSLLQLVRGTGKNAYLK